MRGERSLKNGIIKVGLISLGCSKNLVDSEVMLGILKENGCVITNKSGEADILIINTCSFIKDAAKESEATIREFLKAKKTGRKVIVTGCLVQKEGAALLKRCPGVDAFLGVSEFHRIAEYIGKPLKKKLCVSPPGFLYDEKTPRVLATPAHSAYIKIAEGCNNRCNYCSIPSIRGPLKSRKIESIVNEAKNLAATGVKEINLISQDTTNYGKDLYGRPKLVELLRKLVAVKGAKWIRLLYLYPSRVTGELVALIKKDKKILPYFDISLQHVNDDILRSMGRRYSKHEAEELIRKLRSKIPGAVLRTTFITGYPGETKEKFRELKTFVIKARFDRLGVFAYSKEKGTVSGDLGGQVGEQTAGKRKDILMRIQQDISLELNKRKIGSKIEVLVDRVLEGFAEARSAGDAPDVDGRVIIMPDGGKIEPGEIVKVRVTKAGAYDLIGVLDGKKAQN
jgi:ribosomal protein S12 methylthiotransferase